MQLEILGFACPSLGGFACIEGIIRFLAQRSLGISPGQQRLLTRNFSSAIILLGSPACDFRPYALSQGRRHYIERLSIFYLSFMQICFCKVSDTRVLMFLRETFQGRSALVGFEVVILAHKTN